MSAAAPEETLDVPAAEVVLPADVAVPPHARAAVIFAHGSGSSRHSPRNRHVAAALQGAGYATVLLDLLTEREDEEDGRTGGYRFDIPRIAARLGATVAWWTARSDLPVVLFGASTGAAAALVAAAERSDDVRGVVSRGGRPDLAGDALDRVRCPVLLVVGGADATVLRLNQEAAARLRCPVAVAVVPGATHLFPEPGALDMVVHHALGALRRWVP